MTPKNFYDLTLKDLQDYIVECGLPRFRANQIYRWVYVEGITDFTKMTNISRSLHAQLQEILIFKLPEVVWHKQSTDGTQKLLLEVNDPEMEQQTIEAVLIPSENRLTLCVSSEVGCNMACRFCYTGKQKLKRRLSVSQITGQYLAAQKILPEGMRISNIVFMGMGEPLDNPEAVFKSIDVFHEPSGINLSLKKITISTSGLIPQIPLVTKSKTRLAVSLNGSNDAVRSYVMPINKKWPIADLLKACKDHCEETGDSVTLEYVLLKDVTDSLEDARELHRLTRNLPCKINIIPFNEHPGSEFKRPGEETIRAFQNELIRLGSHVLRRKTMGRDIFAACGQLTSAFKGRPETLQEGVVL
jgi:23S rRNA (adenine2503-C2)-methyltransferase